MEVVGNPQRLEAGFLGQLGLPDKLLRGCSSEDRK